MSCIARPHAPRSSVACSRSSSERMRLIVAGESLIACDGQGGRGGRGGWARWVGAVGAVGAAGAVGAVGAVGGGRVQLQGVRAAGRESGGA